MRKTRWDFHTLKDYIRHTETMANLCRNSRILSIPDGDGSKADYQNSLAAFTQRFHDWAQDNVAGLCAISSYRADATVTVYFETDLDLTKFIIAFSEY